jgi:hypothetical protein
LAKGLFKDLPETHNDARRLAEFLQTDLNWKSEEITKVVDSTVKMKNLHINIDEHIAKLREQSKTAT